MQRFVYQYNNNEKAQDVEDDRTGGMETPIVGSILNRNGKEWKVVRVHAPVSQMGTRPIVRVFLTDRIAQPTFGVKHLPR